MSARLALLVWMALSAALLMSPSTPAARAQPPALDHPIVAAVYVSAPPIIEGGRPGGKDHAVVVCTTGFLASRSALAQNDSRGASL